MQRDCINLQGYVTTGVSVVEFKVVWCWNYVKATHLEQGSLGK